MSKVTTDKSHPTKEGAQDTTPVAPSSADEAIAAAPEPSAKGSKKVVRVMYPTDRFVVEDVPVITAEGTELTSEQVKKAEVEAEKNGVKLVVDDGEAK
jgi:hypothetical protein